MLVEPNIRTPRQLITSINHGLGEGEDLVMVERTRGARCNEGREVDIGIFSIHDIGDDRG